jgi:uncharacterized membrane protein HdeD (DUF308 family)
MVRTVGAREGARATPDTAAPAPAALARIGGILVLVIAALAAGAVMRRSIDLVGALTVAAGVIQLVHAWRRGRVDPTGMTSGILYVVLGGVLATDMAQTRLALALLAALFLTVQGIIRIVATRKGDGSHLTVLHAVVALTFAFLTAGWALLHVIVTLLLDVLTWRVWPLPSVRGIGVFIVVDMVLCGISLLASRRPPRPSSE